MFSDFLSGQIFFFREKLQFGKFWNNFKKLTSIPSPALHAPTPATSPTLQMLSSSLAEYWDDGDRIWYVNTFYTGWLARFTRSPTFYKPWKLRSHPLYHISWMLFRMVLGVRSDLFIQSFSFVSFRCYKFIPSFQYKACEGRLERIYFLAKF